MPISRHAARGAAAAFLLTATALCAEPVLRIDPNPSWRHAASLSELVAIHESWLDDHAPWPRRSAAPAIRVVSGEDAVSIHGRAARGQGELRGLYDPGSETIYLVAPWDPRNVRDAGVLLHELVHHRQAVQQWYCPGAQEMAAYELQDAWLAERGLSAKVDWIAVVLEAGCTPDDIHPE